MKTLASALGAVFLMAPGAHDATVFSGFEATSTTFAILSLDEHTVSIHITSPKLLSDVDISLTALLGDGAVVIFPSIDYLFTSRPSPPFHLGDIELPAQPSRQKFGEVFEVTAEEASAIQRLEFVTLTITDSVGSRETVLRVIPEPSAVMLLLIGIPILGRRRRLP